MSVSVDFQNRFRDLVDELQEKHKTVIAQEMGITYVIFSKAYNYGILPSSKVLVRIADFFSVPMVYLLGDSENYRFEKSKSVQTFQCRLKELLKKNNLTVYDFSQQVHIHRNNVREWLKRNYMPAIDDLILIADYFEVSIDYLLGRTDEE